MKKILVIGFFLLFSSTAFADWAEDFTATAVRSGTEMAVMDALKVGVSPLDIANMVQQDAGIASDEVIKSFYCAGLSGSLVNQTALQAGISNSDVAAGYRQSVGQCGPAAGLNADPFSRATNVAVGGTPVGRTPGDRPGGGPGRGAGPPPVLPPVIDGGGPPPVIPPVSVDRFN